MDYIKIGTGLHNLIIQFVRVARNIYSGYSIKGY